MKAELLFMSDRYNENQDKIKHLELENVKLKNDLNLPTLVKKKPHMDAIQDDSLSKETNKSNFDYY